MVFSAAESRCCLPTKDCSLFHSKDEISAYRGRLAFFFFVVWLLLFQASQLQLLYVAFSDCNIYKTLNLGSPFTLPGWHSNKNWTQLGKSLFVEPHHVHFSTINVRRVGQSVERRTLAFRAGGGGGVGVTAGQTNTQGIKNN